MATAASVADTHFTDTLYLQKESPQKVLRLHDEALLERITKALHARLPQTAGIDSWTRDELVEGFAAIHHFAQALAKSFEDLWELIILAHLDLRASAAQEAMLGTQATARPCVQLVEKVRYNYSTLRSPLSGSLVIQGNAAIAKALVAFRDAISRDLSEHILQCLAAGAGTGVVGASQWLDPTTCCLSWYRSVVIIIEENKSESLSARLAKEVGEASVRVPPVRVVARRTISRDGRFDYRFAQYEHELFDAEAVSSVPCDLRVPKRCEEVWEAVPDYLRPELRLVVGKIIRERVIEVDLESEDWTHREEVDVIEHRVVRDPAITIGPYVLTGWTPAEVKDPTPTVASSLAPQAHDNRLSSLFRSLFH